MTQRGDDSSLRKLEKTLTVVSATVRVSGVPAVQRCYGGYGHVRVGYGQGVPRVVWEGPYIHHCAVPILFLAV